MIDHLLKIAKQAGEVILTYYGDDTHQIKEEDGFISPLNQADLVAHKLIVSELKKIYPNTPIISEEDVPSHEMRQSWNTYFIIDPLDGTKEFIKKSGEFTVNIAYTSPKNNLAVVYAPAKKDIWHSDGTASYKNNKPIEVSGEQKPLRIVASKSHFSKKTKEFIEELNKPYELLQFGSSLKICAIAEGSADIYPRLGPTME